MATRLRKTFRYPTDSDSDAEGPEAMDEEEQDALIQTLHTENATRNAQYTILLLAISLLSTIPYIPTLFNAHTTLLSILSITSLLSTSYLIHILPPTITGLQFLDSLKSKTKSTSSSMPGKTARNAAMKQASLGGGPVEVYLPYLNCGLGFVLVGLGGMVRRRVERGEAGVWMGFEWLPGVIWGATVLVKWVMGGVDPEGELGGLRYGLKGA